MSEPVPPLNIDLRQKNVADLRSHGFICADSLPCSRFETPCSLRPAREVVGRLFAQMAIFMWVAAPEEKATSEGIGKFIVNNSLQDAYTEAEWQILQMDRDDANTAHGAQIGWHLENMWALAWVCGFDPEPTFHDGQISNDVTRSVLEYLPNLGGTIDGFLDASPLRSGTEVSAKEDLFYCAHTAAQSAVLDSGTVHEWFRPG